MSDESKTERAARLDASRARRQEDRDRAAAQARAVLSADDIGMLLWCALSYGRRLPHGLIPPHIWDALNQEWRNKINRWKSGTDETGAQVRTSDRP